MKRIFFGISIPEETRNELFEIARTLNIPGERTIAPQNIHLTLRFIGNATDEQMNFLSERTEKASQKIKPFNIQLNEIGAFPSLKRPRIVWAGVGEGSETLEKIAWELEKVARKLGFKEEKRFHPHFTIIRIKNPKSIPVELPLNINVTQKNIIIKKIDLFESRLKPTGAEYSILKSYPLLEEKAN